MTRRLLVLLCASATVCPAAEPLENFDFSARMRALHIPGASVAIVGGYRVVWGRGFGVMEAASTAQATPAPRFQAASISKPVAAVAAPKLVEEGQLTLAAHGNFR